MSFKPAILLAAHSLTSFGTLLSGIILGDTMVTHRSLNLLAWSVLGAVFVLQFVLTGLHVGCHVTAAAPAPKRATATDSLDFSNLSLDFAAPVGLQLSLR